MVAVKGLMPQAMQGRALQGAQAASRGAARAPTVAGLVLQSFAPGASHVRSLPAAYRAPNLLNLANNAQLRSLRARPQAARAESASTLEVSAMARGKKKKNKAFIPDDDDIIDDMEFPVPEDSVPDPTFAKGETATAVVDAPGEEGDLNGSGSTMTPAEFLDEENAHLQHLKKKNQGKAGASSVSSGVRLEGIKIAFKGEELLSDVTWDVKKGQRVGLVGVNGAGKTTQLEIIRGAIEPDDGYVIKANSKMKIAYLSQEFDITMTNTIREEFMSAYEEAMKVTGAIEETQVALESCPSDDMDLMGRLLDDLDALQKRADRLNVVEIDKKIDIMMPELGFTSEDNDRLVASYSGGWQMRIQIGKMMLSDPDLLLLDEPTNHLDLDAITWLESYLKKQEVPMVVVSHDREFLDQLCNKIVETERGVATEYMGNYTEYVNKKAEKVAQQWTAYEKQQKEIQRQQDLINRLSAGDQAGRASAAQKSLAKLKSEGTFIHKPFEERRRSFRFPEVERCGQKIMSINSLTHGYDDRMLFKDANLEVEKGERIACVGPNGAGKSTLLRLLLGREDAMEGQAALGDHHVYPNYFEQNQAEALDLKVTVLETLERAAPDANLRDIKALLGRFMFKGDAMHKKVEWLSGGEKARLALAKFMLTPATLLVLDEPTNHLDIPSKEMLEDALSCFDEGAVFAVSHDRYFLRKIATRVVEVSDGKLVDQGDYDDFLDKNEDEASKMAAKEAKAREIEKDNIKAKSKMSKAEKAKLKKEKAKNFSAGSGAKKVGKNAKRWN